MSIIVSRIRDVRDPLDCDRFYEATDCAGAPRRALTGKIYDNLHGAGVAVDVIVVTPTDIERYKDSHALVIKPALQEGKVVYESA